MSEKNTSILTICLQKGGAGKTTCAVNLAASYVHLGLKILFVDLDYQSNGTKLLGIDTTTLKYEQTICYAMEHSLKFSEIVISSKFENIDILPSSERLFDFNKNVSGSARQSFYYILYLMMKLLKITI